MNYQIEDRTIDAARRELRHGSGTIPVEPKVFDLLLFLVENRTRVVTKAELVDSLWQGRVISDAALASCVKAARRALGEGGARRGRPSRL